MSLSYGFYRVTESDVNSDCFKCCKQHKLNFIYFHCGGRNLMYIIKLGQIKPKVFWLDSFNQREVSEL